MNGIAKYLPDPLGDQRARNKLIFEYFSDGYDYSMILILLGVCHGFALSMRQLKRVLRKYGLRRRTNTACTGKVEALIRVSLSKNVIQDLKSNFFRMSCRDQASYWVIEHSGVG